MRRRRREGEGERRREGERREKEKEREKERRREGERERGRAWRTKSEVLMIKSDRRQEALDVGLATDDRSRFGQQTRCGTRWTHRREK